MNDPSNKIPEETVLIDTWWNVNAEDCHTLILTDTVLIDTWWNVNPDGSIRSQSII